MRFQLTFRWGIVSYQLSPENYHSTETNLSPNSSRVSTFRLKFFVNPTFLPNLSGSVLDLVKISSILLMQLFWILIEDYIFWNCENKFIYHKANWLLPWLNDSSFPVVHKVGNIVIFVQLLMRIKWKQLSTRSVSNQS